MVARQSKLFRGRNDTYILRKVISKTCLAHQLMSPKIEIFKLALKKKKKTRAFKEREGNLFLVYNLAQIV